MVGWLYEVLRKNGQQLLQFFGEDDDDPLSSSVLSFGAGLPRSIRLGRDKAYPRRGPIVSRPASPVAATETCSGFRLCRSRHRPLLQCLSRPWGLARSDLATPSSGKRQSDPQGENQRVLGPRIASRSADVLNVGLKGHEGGDEVGIRQLEAHFVLHRLRCPRRRADDNRWSEDRG